MESNARGETWLERGPFIIICTMSMICVVFYSWSAPTKPQTLVRKIWKWDGVFWRNLLFVLDLFAYLVLVECRCVTARNRQKMLDFVQRMRVERINMYISIYHDVDAVNPSKMGAEISVNSTADGNFQTCMQWSGKQLNLPLFSPSTNERDEQMQKSDLRRRWRKNLHDWQEINMILFSVTFLIFLTQPLRLKKPVPIIETKGTLIPEWCT